MVIQIPFVFRVKGIGNLTVVFINIMAVTFQFFICQHFFFCSHIDQSAVLGSIQRIIFILCIQVRFCSAGFRQHKSILFPPAEPGECSHAGFIRHCFSYILPGNSSVLPRDLAVSSYRGAGEALQIRFLFFSASLYFSIFFFTVFPCHLYIYRYLWLVVNDQVLCILRIRGISFGNFLAGNQLYF